MLDLTSQGVEHVGMMLRALLRNAGRMTLVAYLRQPTCRAPKTHTPMWTVVFVGVNKDYVPSRVSALLLVPWRGPRFGPSFLRAGRAPTREVAPAGPNYEFVYVRAYVRTDVRMYV